MFPRFVAPNASLSSKLAILQLRQSGCPNPAQGRDGTSRCIWGRAGVPGWWAATLFIYLAVSRSTRAPLRGHDGLMCVCVCVCLVNDPVWGAGLATCTFSSAFRPGDGGSRNVPKLDSHLVASLRHGRAPAETSRQFRGGFWGGALLTSRLRAASSEVLKC